MAIGTVGGGLLVCDGSGGALSGWKRLVDLTATADAVFLSETELAVVDHGYKPEEPLLSVAQWDDVGRGKLVVMRSDGEPDVLANGLHCPMGVATDSREELIVAEFERARIVDASGTVRQAGYPGYLGRIRKTETGYLMACLSRRDPLIEFLKTERDFVDAMKATIPPQHWIAPRVNPEFSHDFPIELGANSALRQDQALGAIVLLWLGDRAERRVEAGRLGAFARRRPAPCDFRRRHLERRSHRRQQSERRTLEPGLRKRLGMSNDPIVALENVTKRYGGIAALDNANFELFPGEIHALAGENGAGKSTLCKLIAGVISPTEGRLSVCGQPVAFSAPKDASRLGISMVFQETSLVPQLTVAQNMALGRERPFNSVRRVRNTARQALQRLNFNVDASQLAGALSAAKRQMVEIARAVLNDARVIIFDEPTAALTPEETEHLFDLMKALRKRGVAMIFISHALEEALTYADRITVLRNGRLMATGRASDFDRASLIKHMIGEDLAERRRGPATRRALPTAAPVLQVENLRMGALVNNMSFSVFPGEVTGIAGLIGSGRSEAAKVVMGHTKRNFGGGRIWLYGREVRYGAPSQAVADGVAYVSEDRKLDGLFETLGVSQNIGLGWLAKFGRGRWVAPARKMNALAQVWEKRLSIRRIGAEQPVLHLSGGNQQKVVIAKALAQEPRLVIFDEPTRGVDVGAVAEIHRIIRELANWGLELW